MYVYRIKCGDDVVFVEADGRLNDADVDLFKSCAVEARRMSEDMDPRDVVDNVIYLFGQQSDIMIHIVNRPWTGTIEI